MAILFCDSSALVKLYLQEDGSDLMAQAVRDADQVAVCRLAWVELMSALARRARERSAGLTTITEARLAFALTWPQFLIVDVTQELMELAGDYAEAFALRAYDSVQLAAVHLIHRELPGEVRFACFDGRLTKAAGVLGIGSL